MSKYILFFLRSNFKLLYFHLTPTFILTVCNKLQKEIKKKSFQKASSLWFLWHTGRAGAGLDADFLAGVVATAL